MQFDENGMLVIPSAQPAPEQEVEQGENPAASVSVTADTEEGASLLQEAWRAVGGGVRDAAQEIGETVQWAGEGIGNKLTGGNDLYWTENDGFEWLNEDEAMRRDDIPEWQTRNLFGDGGTIDLPKVPENETVVGGLGRGITQFVAGYGVVGKSLKLGRAATVGGAAAKGLGQGAVTDFVAFDAHEDRLANLIESVPALSNPITGYLQAEADDTVLEGKLKNVLEGMGMGVAAEGLMLVLRSFKRAKPVANAGNTDEAAKIMNEAAEKVDELQLNLFDETTDPNLKGGDAGPQKVVRKEKPNADAEPVAAEPSVPVRDAETKPRKPINTDALEANLTRDMALRRGGSMPDPNREIEGDLFNFETWDSDVEIKDVMNMATDSIRAAGIKDRTTFNEIIADSKKVVAEYVDTDPTVLERSLARMAGDAEQQQAMVVAAKGLIQSLTEEVTRLAYKIDAGLATDMDMDRFIAMKSRMVETSANLKSVITGAAQTTSAGRIRTSDVVSGQQLSHAEIVRQINDNIADMGGEVNIKKLAKSILDAREANGVTGVMKVAEGVTTGGKVLQEYWINSILSGPKTQIANVTGNLLMSTAVPLQKVVGGVTTANRQSIREGLYHMAGLKVAVGDALRMAGKAFREGRNILDPEAAILEAEGVNYHAIKSSSENALTRNVINWIGTGVRLPSRLLTTGDEFFKQLNYRADLYAKLTVEAADMVADGKLDAAKASKWVADRLETGFAKDGSARHLESLNLARETTFTNELRQGSVSRDVQNFTNKHPIAKMIMPFVRTPTNIMVQFGQHTPLLQYTSKSFKEDLAAGGVRASRARGKQVIGGMFWMSAIMAAAEGKVTGSGPSDPQAKRQLMETGWRPFSVVTTGPDGKKVYTEYKRMDPFAMIFGIAADFAEISGQADEQTTEEVGMAAMVALMNNLGSKTYLTGLFNATKALEDPDRFWQGFVNGYASSMVPMSSAMREARKQQDPMMREVKSMLDAVRNTIPGLSDDLPARRSWVTGKPIIYPHGWGPESLGVAGDIIQSANPYIRSTEKNNPVLDELATLPGALSAPSRKIDGVELTGEQYERYLELHGSLRIGRYTLEDRLGRLFETERYKEMSRDETDPQLDQRTREARRVITQYRDRAKALLIREFPDIRQGVRERELQKRENRRSGLAGIADIAQ